MLDTVNIGALPDKTWVDELGPGPVSPAEKRFVELYEEHYDELHA